MTQFNLLPDVKLQYVKIRRLKRIMTAICILASAAALLIFIVLLSWDFYQKSSLSSLNQQVASEQNNVQNTPDLNKLLTVQNQLQTLPSLDAQKPVVSRLFGYLSDVTPTTATISTLSVDYTQNAITMQGTADSLATINTFADTLKFATFSPVSNTNQKTNAFTNVVLSNFGVDTSGASYTFNFQFNPQLFSSSSQYILNVPPNKITTRSIVDQPTLFLKSPASSTSPAPSGSGG